MRRGQLLSFDALLAIVIVIFMLGAVSATSDNLKAGITNLLGWYDRTSIPDTMLDVLLQSAGTPSNWDENISALVVPGLRASSGQYVDYNKAVTFFDLLKNNDSRVQSALLNLSLGHPFLLDFYLGKWSFEANFTWNPNAGGGIPPGVVQYDCNNATKIQASAYPVLINCSNLLVNYHISSFCSICTTGSVTLRTRPESEIDIIGGYYQCPNLYLAIGGTLSVYGGAARAVKVEEGSIYIKGGITLRGSANLHITAMYNLYVFSDGASSPILDFSGGANTTVDVGYGGGGNLYIKVGDTWYAVTGNPADKDNWYRWDNDHWIKAPEEISIKDVGAGKFVVYAGSIQVIDASGANIQFNIRGISPPPLEWQPVVPYCWQLGPSGPPLTVFSLEGNYIYPQQLNASQAWNRVAYLNGSFLVNPTNVSSVLKARANASWVSYSERNTVISMFQYNRTTTIVGNASGIILAGVLRYDIPDYAMLRVDVPAESGYVLLVAVDGGTLKAIGFWKTSPEDALNAEVWESSGGNVSVVATYRGSNTSVTIPWGVIFSGPAGFGRPVMLYLYSNGFTGPVTLTDEGDIGVLMTPMYEPLLVKLWVWDEP
ncbi:hypothetical protein [Thermococcus nautili]|uniref:Uncharacterized protein n=1 Tax=Thermococcus nautili TaxID=195522 RepID=W8NV15_9EURY|nr:hypothetical protein [Thermococcus nautili]AHL23128.1 hypothetical protein BD01_1520 [Thermococcus nautili]